MSECESNLTYQTDDLVEINDGGEWRPGWYVDGNKGDAPSCWPHFVAYCDTDEDGEIGVSADYFPDDAVRPRGAPTANAADPVALPGGDDCCNRPLPDFFGEADATEPAPPDGYDRELLEIQLASVHRALSVAHAGLIATPVETVAPTLALGMAMESIESLIRDVRGE